MYQRRTDGLIKRVLLSTEHSCPAMRFLSTARFLGFCFYNRHRACSSVSCCKLRLRNKVLVGLSCFDFDSVATVPATSMAPSL